MADLQSSKKSKNDDFLVQGAILAIAAFFFENLGIPAASGYGLEMIDAFSGENLGVKKEFMRFPVKAHDCAVFIGKLTK